MEGVRNIPYGIQQPAVSGQVAQLEQFLGVTLFQRRPFALTAEGEKLYKFIQPFFSNLDKVATELQGGGAGCRLWKASSGLPAATLPTSGSGNFTGYLKAVDQSQIPAPRRHDPLSVYVDALEDQFEN